MGLTSAHGVCEAKTGTRVQCWHPGHVLEKIQKMQSKSGGEARSVELTIDEVDAEWNPGQRLLSLVEQRGRVGSYRQADVTPVTVWSF